VTKSVKLKSHEKRKEGTQELIGGILERQVSCVSATEGRTCGAWWIREPGYTCS